MPGFLITAIIVLTIAANNPDYSAGADYVSSSSKLHCVKTEFAGQSISKRDLAEPADHPNSPSAKEPSISVADSKKIYVHSKTIFLKAATLEAAFRKRNEFLKSGYVFTTEQLAADIVIEIDRAPFTTEFPYSIIDQGTHLVIGSGKVNSIGGTVAGKISSGFIKQIPTIDAILEK